MRASSRCAATRVIARGDIVITRQPDRGGRSVGPRDRFPPVRTVRDVRGKTIMPGLVDIHAHTWVAWGVHRSAGVAVPRAAGLRRHDAARSADVVGGRAHVQDLMETGELIGPRLYSTGPGIFGADNIRSLDDARDVLRRYSDHYNTKTIKQYLAGDRKVRQWVIMAARSWA
jgi:hypothetical protein